MRILLARHGETSWNVEGRHQGAIDIPLSATGEAQARALRDRLAGLEPVRAVSSPLSRARRTAEIVLDGRADLLTLHASLKEISYGTWEGHLATEIRLTDAERQRNWREAPETVHFPGGDSLRAVQDRAWPALEQACTGLQAMDTILVMAHDGVNRTLLCRVLGLPLSRIWSFHQAPTCLNLLEGPDVDHLRVVRLNDSAHLTPLFGEAVHRVI